MRHLHSEFHFRHALFALQGPEGYVDALMESAREHARSATLASRKPRTRPDSSRGAAFSLRR
jgi:hypothetical protein